MMIDQSGMEKKYKTSISVIIPVYNDYNSINSTFKVIHDFLDDNFMEWEIIIIESGSTDGTTQLVDEIAGRFSNTTVFHQAKREGMGSAMKLGYSKCTNELVWKIVPDLPFDLKNIHRAMPCFPDLDYVYSYRINDRRSIKRRLMTLVYNVIIRKVLRLSVRHVNSSFIVLKRNVIDQIDIKSDGWFYQAELLSELKKKEYAFSEIPVSFLPRQKGRSTVSLITSLGVLKEMVSYLFKFYFVNILQ